MNWDFFDEGIAGILVIAGIIYGFAIDFQNGLTLIGIGTSYLFGKSIPKQR
jgi:hypothetical protein